MNKPDNQAGGHPSLVQACALHASQRVRRVGICGRHEQKQGHAHACLSAKQEHHGGQPHRTHARTHRRHHRYP